MDTLYRLVKFLIVCQCVLMTTVAQAVPEVHHRFYHLHESFDFSAFGLQITQDQSGFLWLATQQGLYRFDGSEVLNVADITADGHTLPVSFVNKITLDQLDVLWISNRYHGVFTYDSSSAQLTSIPILQDEDPADAVDVAFIIEGPDQRMWVSVAGLGLFHTNEDRTAFVKLDIPDVVDGVSTRSINDLWIDENQHLWMGSGDFELRAVDSQAGGLIRWNPDTQTGQGWSFDQADSELSSVTRILPSEQGLWLGSYGNGLFHFSTSQQQLSRETVPEAMWQLEVSDMIVTAQGDFWVASLNAGLWKREASAQQWYQMKHSHLNLGLPNNKVYDVYEDQQNTLWVVSSSGFSALTEIGQHVKTLPSGAAEAMMLRSANVYGSDFASEEEIWIANGDGGVAQFNATTLDVVHYPSPVVGNSPQVVRSILQGKDAIWVGTETGLYRLNPATQEWTPVSLPSQQKTEPFVGVLNYDAAGRILVGTRGEGLYVLRESDASVLKHLYPHSADLHLPTQNILHIVVDQRDNIWLGSISEGVMRLDPSYQTLKHWMASDQDANGLSFNLIQHIAEYDGSIWIMAGQIFHRWLNADEGLSFKAYPNPAEDADEFFLQAIDVFHALRFVWVDQYQTLIRLKPLQGIQDRLWTGGVRQVNEWVARGGSEGLDYYSVQDFPDPLPLLPVQLTRFNLFNRIQKPTADGVLKQSLQSLDTLVLAYEQDMISFRFSVPGLHQQEILEYRYRLNGFDNDWIPVSSSERQAVYTRLPPGHYRFEVAARLEGGSWQPSTELTLEVLAPWWMTWWFRLLMLSLLTGVIGGLFYQKIRHEKRVQTKLAELVDRRTAELHKKQDALELTNQRLHASNNDLLLLQNTGLEITASLNLDHVLQRCYEVISSINDVQSMVVALYRPEVRQLEFVFASEFDHRFQVLSVDAARDDMLACICFNEQREILINNVEEVHKFEKIKTQPVRGRLMQTVLYLPLRLGDKTVGVFSVQSLNEHAYSESQLRLLRTFSSNLAVALMNADTYTNLLNTQEQLVIQEKMASLGSLVAGVSHEINTPLGVCITLISHLTNETAEIKQSYQAAQLKQSQLDAYFNLLTNTLKSLDLNAERAAALVRSFKQLSVDQSNEDLRNVNMKVFLENVLLSHSPQLNNEQCPVNLECEENVNWYTDAGALSQILSNLIVNSLMHAFGEQLNPRIDIRVSVDDQQMQMYYSDNGKGMTDIELKQLFEPFYTTRRNQGGTGLGAHIVYNLVTGRFKGHIEVESSPNQGTQYTLSFPLSRFIKSVVN